MTLVPHQQPVRINLVCTVGYRYCLEYISGCPHLKAECFYKVGVCIDWLSAWTRCPYERCVHSKRVSVFTQGLIKRGVCRRSISTLIYIAQMLSWFSGYDAPGSVLSHIIFSLVSASPECPFLMARRF